MKRLTKALLSLLSLSLLLVSLASCTKTDTLVNYPKKEGATFSCVAYTAAQPESSSTEGCRILRVRPTEMGTYYGITAEFGADKDNKNIEILSVYMLAEANTPSSAVKLRLEKIDSNGNRFPKEYQQTFIGAQWATLEFDVADFFSGLDVDDAYALTLTVECPADGDVNGSDFLLQTITVTHNVVLPLVLQKEFLLPVGVTVLGILLGFFATFLPYLSSVKKQKNNSLVNRDLPTETPDAEDLAEPESDFAEPTEENGEEAPTAQTEYAFEQASQYGEEVPQYGEEAPLYGEGVPEEADFRSAEYTEEFVQAPEESDPQEETFEDFSQEAPSDEDVPPLELPEDFENSEA